jgi:hypothetical protein
MKVLVSLKLKLITRIKRITKEFHNNLSYYALIKVQEIKKSTMIEAFEEINLALAAHVNSKLIRLIIKS